jgi:3'-5' exoribonuclease
MADLLTIGALRKALRNEATSARVHAQIDDLIRKEDRNGKPFFEIKLRDSGDSFSLKAWNNSPIFARCEELSRGQAVEIEGDFAFGSYGIDAARWTLRFLEPEEAAELFAGDETSRATNEEDFDLVTALVASIGDPRLQALTATFLEEFSARFRRAAAARNNHHAFRGGLLRHTAQMMKTADALSVVYPRLNRDLLLAGALFHDSGKLWEMCPPEQGFDVPRELRGELLGHISIGIELVNALWRKVATDEWKTLQPPSEDVRLHLLHLVAAHHGELQYGSPVEPKTPEAIALHYVDNLDARLEMIFAAYEKQNEIAPGIYEKVWALNTMPVRGLATWKAPERLRETEGDEPDLL